MCVSVCKELASEQTIVSYDISQQSNCYEPAWTWSATRYITILNFYDIHQIHRIYRCVTI